MQPHVLATVAVWPLGFKADARFAKFLVAGECSVLAGYGAPPVNPLRLVALRGVLPRRGAGLLGARPFPVEA
eukprot:15434420-Alexandrium_andersonii.AAC.1